MCFADANNIYLHDGVSAKPIGGPILKNTLDKTWRIGWLRAVELAEKNNHAINVFYDGPSHSFIVSTKGFCQDTCNYPHQQLGVARAYAFNVLKSRWDYWSIPSVKGYTTSDSNSVYLTDGHFLHSYKTDAANPKDWTWFSKDLTFGRDTQLKFFNKVKLSGSPSFAVSEAFQVLIDDELVTTEIENKNYTTKHSNIDLDAELAQGATTTTIQNATNTDNTYAPFIRNGMYLKIDDEIVKVTSYTLSGKDTVLGLSRAQMGTTDVVHSAGANIYIVAPSFKIPSPNNKGFKIRVQLKEQTGLVDSLGIIWRAKGLK